MVRKLISFLVFLLCMIPGFGNSEAQPDSPDLLKIKSGKISFMSYAPLEIITASSNELRGLINKVENTFAVNVTNKSFVGFNSELQRDHFNERYIESARYENCSYSGKIIEKIDWLKEGEYKVRTKGRLSIHGISQERIIPVTIVVKGSEILISSAFKVRLSDHEISIPAIVDQKIAEEVSIEFNSLFEKK